MKLKIIVGAVCLLVGSVWAGVPSEINHQGVVSVDGTAFDGAGLFRFAIVDPDSGSNLWTNDGSTVGAVGGIPSSPVSLPVAGGVYSVRLGNTNLVNMTPIPSAVFNDDNLLLRIWFDDGVNGLQQLLPEHQLTPSPYAHRAAMSPPIGSIIAWHKDLAGVPALPDGWVECDGGTVSDADSPLNGQAIPDLNTAVDYSAGRFLRGGATSGELQAASRVFRSGAWSDYSASGVREGDGSVIWSDTGLTVSPVIAVGPSSKPGEGYPVRPVNMSVVWIMRVK